MFGFKNIKSLRDSYLIFLYLVWVCCIGNCKMSNCFSLQKLKKAIATMKWNKLSLSIIVRYFIINITVWKVSKYRVISGTYFPVFSPIQENTDQKLLLIWTLFTQCMKLCNDFTKWKFKWFRSVNCFQTNWALKELFKADYKHISIISINH